MNHALYTTTSMLAALAMAAMVIVMRLRAGKKPITVKRIVIPPLMMSSGFLMFVLPPFHLPISSLLGAFVVGLFFSLPIIYTTKFEVIDQEIYVKRSNVFIFILFALLAIRLIIKWVVGDSFTPPQNASLFFVLAFGMIMPWRVAMLILYRRFAQRVVEKG